MRPSNIINEKNSEANSDSSVPTEKDVKLPSIHDNLARLLR